MLVFLCFFKVSGRGARIRTGGLLRPRQARYQAALRPAWTNFG